MYRIVRGLLCLVLACQVIPAGASTASSAAGPALYAVLVGVTKFKDGRVPPLTLSDKDAKDFYDFLKDRGRFFSSAHITVLPNEKATRANVVKALRKELSGAKKDDVVIIYLSGHGTAHPTEPDEYYFVTHDTDIDNLFVTAGLMNDRNLFKGIKSDTVLLLADACHSGGMMSGITKGLIAKAATGFFANLKGLEGRFAIASSLPHERSYEKAVYGNSVFTHFLLKDRWFN